MIGFLPKPIAALGGEIQVPTLDGERTLPVPPGIQSGQRMRVAGEGMPGRGGKRGDLYVELQINVPKKLSQRERDLWSELARLQSG